MKSLIHILNRDILGQQVLSIELNILLIICCVSLGNLHILSVICLKNHNKLVGEEVQLVKTAL